MKLNESRLSVEIEENLKSNIALQVTYILRLRYMGAFLRTKVLLMYSIFVEGSKPRGTPRSKCCPVAGCEVYVASRRGCVQLIIEKSYTDSQPLHQCLSLVHYHSHCPSDSFDSPTTWPDQVVASPTYPSLPAPI